MKKLGALFLVGNLFLVASALATGVSGTWQGVGYSYELYSGPTIQGNWGDQQTSLGTYQDNISGTVANQQVSVTHYAGPTLQGTVPCGAFTLGLYSGPIIDGTLCGEHTSYQASSDRDAYRFLKRTVMEQVLDPIPEPAREFFERTFWPVVNHWF